MTQAELLRRALVRLNDDPDAPLFWSQDEMRNLLQEAAEVLAEEVEALTRTYLVPLRAGTTYYPLSGLGPGVMTPWRVWTRQRQHRLWSLSLPELDAHYERWQSVSGEPEWWFLLSWDCLGVWPRPTTGGGVLEVDCYVWPAPLLDDSAEPETPDPDHDVLLAYMDVEGQCKQWDVARALEVLLPLTQRWRDSQARSGLRVVQERFFGREGRGREAWR